MYSEKCTLSEQMLKYSINHSPTKMFLNRSNRKSNRKKSITVTLGSITFQSITFLLLFIRSITLAPSLKQALFNLD